MMIDYPDDGLESICARHQAELAVEIVPPALFSSKFIDFELALVTGEQKPDYIVYKFQQYFLSTYQSFDAFHQQFKGLFRTDILSPEGQKIIRKMLKKEHYKKDAYRRKQKDVFVSLMKHGLYLNDEFVEDPYPDTITFYHAIIHTTPSKKNFIANEFKYWTEMRKTSKYEVDLQDEVHREFLTDMFNGIEHDNNLREDSKVQILENIEGLADDIYYYAPK